MGCFEANRGDHAGFVRLLPTLDTNTPAVAGLQAGKAILRARRDEVVPDGNLMLQEFGSDDGAHGVFAEILGAGVALAVAVKAGERVGAAGLESGA